MSDQKCGKVSRVGESRDDTHANSLTQVENTANTISQSCFQFYFKNWRRVQFSENLTSKC